MTTPTAPGAPAVPSAPRLPARTWAAIFLRLLAVQGAWNYEDMLGNGIAFCLEPALRHLPGGPGGPAYQAAVARQATFFNAHPYFAGVAVGALARAELDGEPAARIERFRTALCSPLGSVGDQLVWAGWLPFCSVLGLAAFGLGAGPATVVLVFLAVYNAGHLALRAWALHTGWTRGLRVAAALATPALRRAPNDAVRAASLVGGVALPLLLQRLTGGGGYGVGAAAAVVAGVALLARAHGRVSGWQLALGALTALVLFSVARHG